MPLLPSPSRPWPCPPRRTCAFRAEATLVASRFGELGHGTSLAEGGRLVLPVGDSQQTLQLIERSGSQLTSRILEPVRFVPLIDGDVE